VTLVVVAALVALVAFLGAAAWDRGDLNRFICDGDCGPSNVVAPAGLKAPPAPVVARPAAPGGGPVDPAKLAAAVTPELGDGVLGPRVGFSAASPDGTELFSSGTTALAPASTTKVLTSFAALRTIAPGTRFTTKVVRSGDGIVLVGGGDPYLATKRPGKAGDRVARGDLTTLARRTAAALKKAGTTTVTLGYDASLFSGRSASPTWEPSYVPGNIVTPVSALWADQGVSSGVRARDPADAAARVFAGLLADRGIDVTGRPSSGAAPAGAGTIAMVRSATIEQIVERLIRVSDNQAAEVVLRHVAVAAEVGLAPGGGAAAVKAALEEAGVDTAGLVLHDGSGLSRDNRVSPQTLVQTVRIAAGSARTSALLSDLPVSGFTGTLVDRFAELAPARGAVRAKTGTLTGIHSLAGYATDADGRPVLFAVMADRSDPAQPLQAQAALDRVAAAIATCSCGA
jgi:D-alanyl-D-alanine carboxypeptidase/D-alanyl-D-alanine-endopeptidase (penicillin-binding protein 4)